MKRIFFLLVLSLGLFSCEKQVIEPGVIEQPVPTNPNPQDISYSLVGQTWVITKVLNTGFDFETRTDTLVFMANNTYSFNGVQSTYSFYPNNVNYTLTLNNTPWGHISGGIYDYNITEGSILNCQFRNYFTGQEVVKIWIERI